VRPDRTGVTVYGIRRVDRRRTVACQCHGFLSRSQQYSKRRRAVFKCNWARLFHELVYIYVHWHPAAAEREGAR
jgi:hypothetical protein